MTEIHHFTIERLRRSLISMEREAFLFSKLVPMMVKSLSKIASSYRDGFERVEAKECLSEIKRLVDEQTKESSHE